MLVAAAVAVPSASVNAKPMLQVVGGAAALSQAEKADVDGRCGCPAPALSSKPGYGFGTTGHYGPPGQGFTPSNNWRNHAAGDGLTPTGRPLPPRAFK